MSDRAKGWLLALAAGVIFWGLVTGLVFICAAAAK